MGGSGPLFFLEIDMADAGQDALAIMLGGAGGPPAGPEEPVPGGEDDSYLEAFQDAAVAAMDAYGAGDMESFSMNLKDAIEICVEQKEATGGGGGIEVPEMEY